MDTHLIPRFVSHMLSYDLAINICQALLHGNVDHLMSHITFSQNCVMIHKKDREMWKQAEENNVQNYHAAEPAYNPRTDPTRHGFRTYKAASSWQVNGMQRGPEQEPGGWLLISYIAIISGVCVAVVAFGYRKSSSSMNTRKLIGSVASG